MPFTPQELDHMIGGASDARAAFCLHCGYNLTGAVSERCPECGMSLTGRECRVLATTLRRQLRAAHEARTFSRTALWLSVLSVVSSGLSWPAVGTCFGFALRTLALVSGTAGIFLGIGVFRTAQLPSWMREQGIFDPPRYSLAVSAIVLGLLGAVLAFVL